MKTFCILIVAAMLVATIIPEGEAQMGMGMGGRGVMRRGGGGMRGGGMRYGRDVDHVLETEAAGGAEDELEEQVRGARDIIGEGLREIGDLEDSPRREGFDGRREGDFGRGGGRGGGFGGSF